jgi:aminopeptidase
MARARGKALAEIRAAQLSSRVPWCVMPAATEAWAAKILSASACASACPGAGASADRLWELLAGILRLDRPDPAAELRAHMEAIDARARALNALALRELRFLGPGTDLRVRLAPESLWAGGSDKTPEGRPFMPNIPTEETFATPDFRGTEGHVALTMPVRVLGSLVVGGYLRFEGGRVVESGAASGAASLQSYIETDSGSHRLGEVALVDSANPIGKSGLVFESGLIDENAACHIALGSGFEPCFEGAPGWGEAEKEARGFNASVVHQDLMIGSSEIDVMGFDESGREIPLLRRGSFVI